MLLEISQNNIYDHGSEGFTWATMTSTKSVWWDCILIITQLPNTYRVVRLQNQISDQTSDHIHRIIYTYRLEYELHFITLLYLYLNLND